MNNKRIKARQEIVGLLRGFYFLPIFLNLHKLGILNKFSNNRFISLYKLRYKNTIFIKRILDYLVRLDLFERKKSSYRITKFGIFISKRIGTMYILNSYSKIINNFSGNLTKVIKESSWCERKDNIIGSGLIHIKKFFEPSLKLINLNKTNNFLDIGCGDGTFLNVVKKANRNINILGCDLSNESVKQTQKKLFFKKNKNIFQSNGLDISKIKNKRWVLPNFDFGFKVTENLALTSKIYGFVTNNNQPQVLSVGGQYFFGDKDKSSVFSVSKTSLKGLKDFRLSCLTLNIKKWGRWNNIFFNIGIGSNFFKEATYDINPQIPRKIEGRTNFLSFSFMKQIYDVVAGGSLKLHPQRQYFSWFVQKNI